MLFSSAELAQYISQLFEPAWESVRDVPIVTIDFGKGNVIKRTLHGNIATYVCTADGGVLDVMPGIYTPDVYRQRLEQFRLLHLYANSLKAKRGAPPRNAAQSEPAEAMAACLADYHRRQATALRQNRAAEVLAFVPDGGKLVIEMPVKLVAATSIPTVKPTVSAKPATKAEELATWQALADDTRHNETVRRLQIHEKLAETGPVRPEALVKWLYKDVLHADLDDPYLGLRDILFKDYPFAAEDKPTQ